MNLGRMPLTTTRRSRLFSGIILEDPRSERKEVGWSWRFVRCLGRENSASL